MKKIKLILPLAILIIALQIGCNDNKEPRTNSAKEATSTSDTAVKKDTIQSDPEKFSDPH